MPRIIIALALALFTLPAAATPPKVVVDIAPVHALVAQVMEGVATPELLLTQDADPHMVQLRPSQARMLQDADLIIWVGPDLSPWLEHALSHLGNPPALALMGNPVTHLRDFTPPLGAEEHDGEGDHDDHAHSGKDPHVWMSVDNARAWLGLFADRLSELDPENAAAYQANARVAEARIDDLTARIEARLAPVAGAKIVTFHAAFGYFADRFPITIAASVRPGDASTPSAATIARLKELVASEDIACAFAEPAFNPALLKTIAGETGLKIGTLDPTGALQQPGPDNYAATLYAVADNIATCVEAK